MRERLRENLSLRLWLKRLAFGTLGAALRLGARAHNFAERVLESAAANGLDLHRAGVVRPRPPQVEPWGAADFLFLARERGAAPARPVNTSVIVHAPGGAERTFQCLRSLMREVDFDDTEIIVVDDATTDETRELLSHFGNLLRALRNEEVIGPAGALNRGAAEALGRNLVFLGHDCVALPGWLRQLAEMAEHDARAGAVGSMLLGADGRVREAGGVIWRDGGLLRYGSGESPDDRRYCFAREVDYCSPASLLVRRELFERLGGFDTRYAADGYEGADLCVGARSLGFRVIYQPLSRVVSYSSDGRRATADRAEFCGKWREALDREHAAREGGDAEAAANRRWGTQVAVFDDLIPTPDRDAGSARMMHILRALSEWAHPVFITTGKLLRPEYEKLLWREGIETASALDFKRLLGRRRFRAAILSRPAVAAAMLGPVRRAAPGLKIVYDMLDVHHLRSAREAALTGDRRAAREAEAYRRMETRTARSVDLIWCGSRNDKEIMERVAPGVPSVVVPTIHELHAAGPPFEAREHLLFVGSFAHRPNVDAVHFMAREVMPLVRQSLAGAELLVVGGGAPPEFAEYAPQGVRVLGYVPDLVPLMHGCRLFVAPIRFGSGVNGKIGEAISYGLPVVTTSIGAEGWGFTPGEQVLIADGAGDFAEAVVRLYGDGALWQKLAERGRRHIAENFTRAVIGRVINDSLRGDIWRGGSAA